MEQGRTEHGRVESVNVGTARTFEWEGVTLTTAIFKHPVAGRVAVRSTNVDGDEQANGIDHGGTEQALYVYAAEDAEWWAGHVGRHLEAGAFGENLTLRGIDVNEARVGERWRVGSALLEVRKPRIPCVKLGMRMGDRHFPRTFASANRPGAYLAVVEEGDVGAGDVVRIVERPDHDVTVALIARAFHGERHLAKRLLTAPALSDDWRAWVDKTLQDAGTRE